MKAKINMAGVLLLVVWAGCSSGISQEQKKDLAAMTPAQRDKVGMELAQGMRQRAKQGGQQDIQKASYRKRDNTVVVDVVTHSAADFQKLDSISRKEVVRKVSDGTRKRVCRDSFLRDWMKYGGYAVEYRLVAPNGRMLFKPVRVTRADCG